MHKIPPLRWMGYGDPNMPVDAMQGVATEGVATESKIHKIPPLGWIGYGDTYLWM